MRIDGNRGRQGGPDDAIKASYSARGLHRCPRLRSAPNPANRLLNSLYAVPAKARIALLVVRVALPSQPEVTGRVDLEPNLVVRAPRATQASALPIPVRQNTFQLPVTNDSIGHRNRPLRERCESSTSRCALPQDGFACALATIRLRRSTEHLPFVNAVALRQRRRYGSRGALPDPVVSARPCQRLGYPLVIFRTDSSALGLAHQGGS